MSKRDIPFLFLDIFKRLYAFFLQTLRNNFKNIFYIRFFELLFYLSNIARCHAKFRLTKKNIPFQISSLFFFNLIFSETAFATSFI